MILFPAIDLKDGACVRLREGLMDTATVFALDPAAQAASFEAQGFEWLHVVDLDGAFAGAPVNQAAVRAIRAATRFPIQLGGGIRDMATIAAWLEAGVTRVILGTVAVRNPDLVREACRQFPGQIVLGLDAKGGKVAVQGWAEATELTTTEMAMRFEDAGAAAIVFTDVGRDGLLKGLNIEATLALARATKTPVIASGGLGSMADIDRLAMPECAVLEGAISGRALYDGRIDVPKALSILAKAARTPRSGATG